MSEEKEQNEVEEVDNLLIYKQLKEVPDTAKKKIGAGRLKGFTDINPMWRLKRLTEVFGVCGFGWKYEITEKRLEVGCKDQISAFVTVKLYVKINDEWSAPIEGVGGSSFTTLESKGLYQSDECFKMALTDALGIAAKPLGLCADVYFEKDITKHNSVESKEDSELMSEEDFLSLQDWLSSTGTSEQALCKAFKVESLNQITKKQFPLAITALKNKAKQK